MNIDELKTQVEGDSPKNGDRVGQCFISLYGNQLQAKKANAQK